MSAGSYYKKAIKSVVKEKMRCLSDFGICGMRDKEMASRLEQAILEKPDKDPREVLDYFCRPMIQAKVNSWGD